MALDQHADIAFIGSGALARTVAGGALSAGRSVLGIASRSSTCALAEELDLPTLTHDAALRADVVFLCVPDEAIAEVCGSLPWRTGQLAVHAAGALDLDVLSQAADAGAHVGSLHPVMVLHRGNGSPDVLRGATATIEGNAESSSWLMAFGEALGLQPVTIDPGQRPLYHLSAALTGGLLTGLLADAASLWTALGHDAATGAAALGPMVQQAGHMLETHGADGVVMGPAARGDAGTIKRHIDAINVEAPHLLPMYRELVRSSMRHADLTADQQQAIEALLAS